MSAPTSDAIEELEMTSPRLETSIPAESVCAQTALADRSSAASKDNEMARADGEAEEKNFMASLSS
jgi:hypothetical protein